MRRNPLLLAWLIVARVAVAGCGAAKNVRVTGKVVNVDAAYLPLKERQVTVTFVALNSNDMSGDMAAAGQPYLAEFDPTSGTFTVPGPDGRGIPAGNNVAVTQTLERAAFDATREKLTDQLNKKAFVRDDGTLGDQFGLTTSPIVVDVSRSQEVTVDLDTVPAPAAKVRAGVQ
jgi:hypothetical protein